jgi:transposase
MDESRRLGANLADTAGSGPGARGPVRDLVHRRHEHPRHPSGLGRWKKGGPDEPLDHALGKSRGGLTTKLLLVCDANGLGLATVALPGHRHESLVFEETMNQVRIPTPGPGRPVQRPRRLGADKAFSNQRIRLWCRGRRIRTAIPIKADQRRQQLAKRRRLPAFDKAVYRGRNIIERLNGWLKEFRAVATRYDKYARNFLGTVQIALLSRTLRTHFSNST